MSATRVGVTGDWPAFGIKSGTTTWGYFQSKSFEDGSEKNELADEDGDFVAVAYYGFKKTISFDARIKTTGTPGDTANGGVSANGGVLAFEHPLYGTMNVVMDSVSISESNTEWVSISGNATYYPEITVTTTTT